MMNIIKRICWSQIVDWWSAVSASAQRYIDVCD